MSDFDVEDYVQFLYLCPVGLLDVDDTGAVRMVNPAAVRLLAPAMDEPELRTVLPLLERLAPVVARELQARGPSGRLPVGRVVACTDPARDTWVGLDVVRIDPDRLMIVVDDATTEERLTRHEARAALEINDTVVQSLVAAEAALDLDRPELARDLVSSASRVARQWVGRQLAGAGGVAAGVTRAEAASAVREKEG